MDQSMTKVEFLNLLITEHEQWESLLAQIPKERMEEPGVAGDGLWSVKDLIAHTTWYEREMVGVLQAHALVGSDLWSLSTPERNAVIFEQNRRRSLPDLLAGARQVFQQLLAAAETLTDEDLNDPGKFPGMEADWVPWQLIAGNSYLHEREHREQVRAWLDAQ